MCWRFACIIRLATANVTLNHTTLIRNAAPVPQHTRAYLILDLSLLCRLLSMQQLHLSLPPVFFNFISTTTSSNLNHILHFDRVPILQILSTKQVISLCMSSFIIFGCVWACRGDVLIPHLFSVSPPAVSNSTNRLSIRSEYM